jgi:hypothetical protein
MCLVRAGGMNGRARDEALALAAGVPADEGLAAGGLACFLRGRALISALAARCRSFAPSAVFLQMSSPLGLNVAITRDAFGPAHEHRSCRGAEHASAYSATRDSPAGAGAQHDPTGSAMRRPLRSSH